MDGGFWVLYGEDIGRFFWKSGWAFVLGYFISAMIQAFVPIGRLTPYIGNPRPTSLDLTILFDAISSSCSFAAFGVMPTSARKVEEVAQFKIDYSFWMNIFAVLITGILSYSHYHYMKIKKMKMEKSPEGISLKKITTYIFIFVLIGGGCAYLLN
jgi:uncharacterized membrane protein YraQ (UPF0718 family)